MQVAANKKRKRRKKKKGATSATGQFRSSGNDPLQSFNDGDVNLEGLGGGGDGDNDDEEMPEFGDGPASKKQKTSGGHDDSEKKVFTSTRDGTGKSTAGRNAWKERHGKGKFSGKKRKS